MFLISKKKCEQYWPEKIGETLELQNGMVITMTSSVQFADYVIRDFKASKVKRRKREREKEGGGEGEKEEKEDSCTLVEIVCLYVHVH